MALPTIEWTPEMDEMIMENWKEWGPTKIAHVLGVSRDSVRGRWRKLREGWEIGGEDCCHKPFTPRCGEILRAHGWKI